MRGSVKPKNLHQRLHDKKHHTRGDTLSMPPRAKHIQPLVGFTTNRGTNTDALPQRTSSPRSIEDLAITSHTLQMSAASTQFCQWTLTAPRPAPSQGPRDALRIFQSSHKPKRSSAPQPSRGSHDSATTRTHSGVHSGSRSHAPGPSLASPDALPIKVQT